MSEVFIFLIVIVLLSSIGYAQINVGFNPQPVNDGEELQIDITASDTFYYRIYVYDEYGINLDIIPISCPGYNQCESQDIAYIVPSGWSSGTYSVAVYEYVDSIGMGWDYFYFDVIGQSSSEGLVAHYEFENDEAVRSGGKTKTKTKTPSYFLVKDSSENNNDGIFYNGDIGNYVDGKSGKGVSFDGVNDYINTQYGDVISEATYSFWFKADPINRNTQKFFIGAVSDYNGNPSKAFFQYGFHYARCGEGKLGFAFRDSDNPTTATEWGCSDNTYDDSEWHHSALVYGLSDIKLYVDGNLETSTPITDISDGDKDFTLYPYYVGARNSINSPAGFFNGVIDEVRIYNRALSALKIQELSNEFNEEPECGDGICQGSTKYDFYNKEMKEIVDYRTGMIRNISAEIASFDTVRVSIDNLGKLGSVELSEGEVGELDGLLIQNHRPAGAKGGIVLTIGENDMTCLEDCKGPCGEAMWCYCSECGNGWFNICDETECQEQIAESCYFTPKLIGGDCKEFIITVSREITPITSDTYGVSLNIDVNEDIEMNAFGIVEYFPTGWHAYDVSNGGVIRDDRIEWIANEFTELHVQDTQLSYKLVKTNGNNVFSGSWITAGPEESGEIEGEISLG